MTAVTVLCEGTIKAAGAILRSKNIEITDYDKLSSDLKVELKANIETVMKEWQEAIDARLSEAWLREMMNAQCNQLALNALKIGGWF